jgi:hypothetical protein
MTISEPVTIAEWWKNRSADGKRKPGKGFAAAEVRHLPRLAAEMAKAENKARKLGLLSGKGAEREGSGND